MINFRINIAGFMGPPVSLFAAYSHETDLLVIAKDPGAYDASPRDGFLKITNQSRDASYDALFDNDNMADAIKAYFEMESLRLVTIRADVVRHTPGSKIERDGFSDTGVKYRISPDMTSGQVAVMVACLYASQQKGVSAALSFADDMIFVGDDIAPHIKSERDRLREWGML